MANKLTPKDLDLPPPRFVLDDNKYKLEQRRQLLDGMLSKHFLTDEPDEEPLEDPFDIPMEVDKAILFIQKNERGRQGRKIGLEALEQLQKHKKALDKKERFASGLEVDNDEDEKKMAIRIPQKVFRAFQARARVNAMRQEELEFLGMAPKPGSDEHRKRDYVRQVRKMVQQE